MVVLSERKSDQEPGNWLKSPSIPNVMYLIVFPRKLSCSSGKPPSFAAFSTADSKAATSSSGTAVIESGQIPPPSGIVAQPVQLGPSVAKASRSRKPARFS